MIDTAKQKFPQKKNRWSVRGGIFAYCPNEKMLLSVDETRQMTVPPFRLVCNRCGAFVSRHIDPNIFG